MKLRILLVLLAVGIFAVGAHAADVVADMDATLEELEPDSRWGGVSAASSVWNRGGDRLRLWRTLEHYDLSAYAGQTVTSCSVSFDIKGVSDEYKTANMHAMTAAWSETTTSGDPLLPSWNNMASNYDATVLHSYRLVDYGTSGVVTITGIPVSIPQGWIDNPAGNLGWMVKLSDPDEGLDSGGWEYWSQNSFPGDTADPPTMHLTFAPEPVTMVLLGLGGLAAIRRRK